jgi:hypothetical protein
MDEFGKHAKSVPVPRCSTMAHSFGSSSRSLRLFAFLVCLRLLKVNISHLVQWNVDPKEVRRRGTARPSTPAG